jgi:3-dehydrosphinganine reductase
VHGLIIKYDLTVERFRFSVPLQLSAQCGNTFFAGNSVCLWGAMEVTRRKYRSAVITGGSSGIGFAAASYLVRRGTDVLLVARNSEKLSTAAQRLSMEAAEGASVRTLSLDIADRSALTALEEACTGADAPDLLINCAGIAYPNYFEKIDDKKFDAAVDTNLRGTWNVLKTLVPHLKSGSTIVNVSSMAGLVGTFGYTAYAATKFGIIGMSEALRNEMTLRGIRVAVLCPPDTDTPQLEQENLSKPPETKAISGNAGILKPQQVAEALFAGLERKKFIIIPGVQGKLIYCIKRLLPRVLYAVIDRTAKQQAGRRE